MLTRVLYEGDIDEKDDDESGCKNVGVVDQNNHDLGGDVAYHLIIKGCDNGHLTIKGDDNIHEIIKGYDNDHLIIKGYDNDHLIIKGDDNNHEIIKGDCKITLEEVEETSGKGKGSLAAVGNIIFL